MTPTSGRRRLRVALLLGVGAAVTGLALLAYEANLFRGLELDSVDARFSVRGERGPPSDVVVVKIDDLSFDELHESWPFRRSFHGRLIRRLKREDAKVIAFDVQFSEPSPGYDGARQDNQFLRAARAAGNLVFSTTEVDEQNRPNFLGGEEGIRYVRARVGSGNFHSDPGGVIRRIPYEIDGLKSFAVVTLERATGKKVRPFSGDRKLIDFRGPPGTVRSVSYSRVLAGDFPKGFFRNKIVVVGAAAASLQDIHPTSTGARMPAPEIQANAISTALRGFPLTSVPAWVTLLSIVALGLLAPLVSLRLSPFWTLVLAISAAVAYVVSTQVAFEHGWVLSFVYPFGALVLASLGSLAVVHGLAPLQYRLN